MSEELFSWSDASTMATSIGTMFTAVEDMTTASKKAIKGVEVLVKVAKFLDVIGKIGSFVPGLSALSGIFTIINIF